MLNTAGEIIVLSSDFPEDSVNDKWKKLISLYTVDKVSYISISTQEMLRFYSVWNFLVCEPSNLQSISSQDTNRLHYPNPWTEVSCIDSDGLLYQPKLRGQFLCLNN